jgi:hypothetical protein
VHSGTRCWPVARQGCREQRSAHRAAPRC